MVKKGTKRESRPVPMMTALRRRTGNVKFDEVPIPGKDANLRIERDSKVPARRWLAGLATKTLAYYGVEVFRASFDRSQTRREDEMIQFAQKHRGVRGVALRAVRWAVFPYTTTKYDHEVMKNELGSDFDKVASTTWTASINIPRGHETVLGNRLTPEMLTKGLLGMLAVAGFNEQQVEESVSLRVDHSVDEKALYDMAQNGRITEGQLEAMGSAEETWRTKLTPQLEGAAQPDLGTSLAGTEPIPLQP